MRNACASGFVVAMLWCSVPAAAQCDFTSSSEGSDGPLTITENTVIDLRLAVPGNWDEPGNGNGVYDADKWIVVFKFTSIDIAAGTTVTLQNHPSGAPVVWLSQGDVVIAGTVDLSGQNTMGGDEYDYTEPGAGGFAGGADQSPYPASAGFGPGGALATGVPADQRGGTFAGTYGSPSLLPLIGGSGGVGGNQVSGAGSGAILVASSGTIEVPAGGLIDADGGTSAGTAGGGSGGGIRLIADTIVGNGTLRARGGTGTGAGGPGRIRLEACDHDGFVGNTDPPETRSAPGQEVQDATTPQLTLLQVNGIPVTIDPGAGVLTKDVISETTSITLTIGAVNIPPGTVVNVVIAPAHGAGFSVESAPLEGTFESSTATAEFELPGSFPADIQLYANW